MGWFNKLKVNMFNRFDKSTDGMLLVTGALGWFFSGVAQVMAVKQNKEIKDKEQKGFLVLQETFETGINILSFIAVTFSIQKLSRRLVSMGKITTPKIQEFCQKNKIENFGKSSCNIKKTINEEIKVIKEIFDAEKKELDFNLTPARKALHQNRLAELETFKDKHYDDFEGGVGIVGNLLGAILSCNLIVPALKNPLAAMKHKMSTSKKEEEKLEVESQNSQVVGKSLDVNTVDKSNVKNIANIKGAVTLYATVARPSMDDFKKQFPSRTNSYNRNGQMKV